MTSLVAQTPARVSRPTMDQAAGYCQRAILDAATRIWPGRHVTLIEQVPSVTGYVHRIEIDGRSLYAKVSLLGASLVSILLGRHGNWSHVQAAQRHYVTRADTLLLREAAQLRFLTALGYPGVTAFYETGVLFTQPAQGQPLAEIARTDPARLAELLSQVWRLLDRLHTSRNRCVTIDERHIATTFTRKFGHTPGLAERLGLTEQPAEVVASLLRAAVPLRTLPGPGPGTGLVYGELKPEHILVGPDATVTLIDPGIMRGPIVADAAKLTSRLLLTLLCTTPHNPRDTAVAVQAVQQFTHRLAAAVPTSDRPAWWRDLVGLWLRDTLNLTSTYLAAPADLPLPAHGATLRSRAGRVCALVEATATTLTHHPDPYRAWQCGIAEVLAR